MKILKRTLTLSLLFILLQFIFVNINFVEAVQEVSNEEISKIAQVLSDGVYEIETKIDSNMVVDISGGSELSRANVQIWQKTNARQQRFKFTYLGNGSYMIESVRSGKVLDVDNAGTKKGTNVQQYTSNSTNAQKWIIKQTKDNYYTIISKCNNLALTVTNSKTSNGTNIEVNESLNLDNQKFIIRKIKTVEGKQTVENGLYTISTALDKNKVLDVSAASTLSGANIQIWKNDDVAQQKFYVEYDGFGYYTITNLHSGKLVDVANAEIERGTNVQQYTRNSTDAQKWVIKETSDGYYNIISKCSGIYLEVKNGSTKNGTNVQINMPSNNNRKKFLFNKIDDDSQVAQVKNGSYEITTKIASNMLLDVSTGSSDDGVNVQIWADANEKQQKFEFTYVGNGLYKIICKRSNKALTVSTAGTNYSSNVYQSTYKGFSNQLWKIVKSNNKGFYYIVSMYNGRYLDVDGGKTSNGTNIRVYVANCSDAQKFTLEQKKYGIDVSHWQYEIDFKTLYNSQKIDFMIIRAGYGTTLKDNQFENNYKGVKKYNIPTGAYLYARAQSVEEARNEANHLVQMLKGKSFELPIFYDVEEQAYLSKSTITQMCIEFYDILKKAGMRPGIYANRYYLTTKIDVNKLPKDCAVWVAAYGKNNGTIPSDSYKYNGDYDIWQYTSTGSVPGIKGDVDCDVSYKEDLWM